MAKDTYYFSHDFNARNDEKILELRSNFGAEGYGIFWMIVETMAENENGGINGVLIGGLSHGYGVSKSLLKEILDCCVRVGLFYEKDGFYLSNRLLAYKEFRKVQSEYGKVGAEKRWGGHRGANGSANAKERKGKEIKENRGINFLPELLEVVFEDGSKQKLGEVQSLEFKNGRLLPKQVVKGNIY